MRNKEWEQSKEAELDESRLEEHRAGSGKTISRRALLASLGTAGAVMAASALWPDRSYAATIADAVSGERDERKKEKHDKKKRQSAACECSVEDFGAVGDGVTDDTAAIQLAIDSADGKTLCVPGHLTCVVSTLLLPSNIHFKVDGTLLKKAGTAGAIIRNADQTLGNDRIRITVGGTIDGNKSGQTQVENKVGLLDFVKCSHISVQAAGVIRGNYFPIALASNLTTACVYVKNSAFVSVNISKLEDYGREALWLQNCSDSNIEGLNAIGGADSWSGLQISGTRNMICNVRVIDAGASGISIDSTHSVISDCIVKDNKYFNGFNFGHAGVPAHYTTVVNCISINAGHMTTSATNVANGFNIVAGSQSVALVNCRAIGAYRHGFNVSDNAVDAVLTGCVATGCGVFGLTTWNTKLQATSCDFRGNTHRFNQGGTTEAILTSVRLADDPMSQTVSVAGLGAGGTVTVANLNVTAGSKLTLQPVNGEGVDAGAFISQVDKGSFVITTRSNGAPGAAVRADIG